MKKKSLIISIIAILIIGLFVVWYIAKGKDTNPTVSSDVKTTPIPTQSSLSDEPTSEPEEPTLSLVPTAAATPKPTNTSRVEDNTSKNHINEEDYYYDSEGKLVYSDELIIFVASFEKFKDLEKDIIKKVIETKGFDNLIKFGKAFNDIQGTLEANLVDEEYANSLIREAKSKLITPTPKVLTWGDNGEYTFTEINKLMYATESVNLRQGPSTSYDKTCNAPKGDPVHVIAKCNEVDWYWVYYMRAEHFVESKYISEVAPTSTPTPKPTATPKPKPTATPTPKITFPVLSEDDEPMIVVSEREVVVNEIEYKTIYITYNRDVEIEGFMSSDIVSASLMQYDDRTAELTIRGREEGKTEIEVYYKDNPEVCEVISVTVNIDGSKYIKGYPDEIVFTDNKPQTIKFTLTADRKYYYDLSFYSPLIKNEHKLNGNTVEFTITPKKIGSELLEITYFDARDFYASVYIPLTVDINTPTSLESKDTVELKDAFAGATVKFGKYEQDNNLSNGQEEIEWFVLDVQDGKALLLSKYVLDNIDYDESSGIWRGSDISKWLNDTFYNVVFNNNEKSKLCPKSLGDKGDTYNVFLLTKEEAEMYFTEHDFINEKGVELANGVTIATEYAKGQGVEYNKEINLSTFGLTSWWLRRDDIASNIYYYSTEGKAIKSEPGDYSFYFSMGGTGDYIYTEINKGVRPAIWVNIN